MRRDQRQCPPNRPQRQSGLHRPPLCLSAMLTREFRVMVGLMSGKAKSAIPQNWVGSRSRGWVERLVCGSCHQLGDHSWWWGPPDSNRRPPAGKARSGAAVTCEHGKRGRSRPPRRCPWVSAGDRMVVDQTWTKPRPSTRHPEGFMPACFGRAPAWTGSSRLCALITSQLSNASLRPNAANSVTGYDQATLLKRWAVQALTLPSNRDHAPCRPHPLGTSKHLGT